jgi:RND family efflux transporter MFP subunit
VISVRTVPVVVRDLPRVLDLPGTIDAAKQVAIVAQTSGVLQQQRVQEGQAVRAGELLFTLDARPLSAQIAQHRATLAGTQAAERQAGRLVTQLAPLNAPGYISRKEFSDAQLAQTSAQANAGAARAALQAAQLEWNNTQIHSPIAGRVGRINVQPGSLVQANAQTPLTTIIAPGALDVRASVAQQDWPQLAEARARGKVFAEIYTAENKTVIARGELVFVDSQIAAATGAVAIKVRLIAPPPSLLSGQGVRMRLLLGDEANVRVIPDSALQQAQEGSYVYVVRGGKAVLQRVTAVRTLDNNVVVDGKLAAGEPVLIEIPQRLKDGSKVQLEGASRGGGKGDRAGGGEGRKRGPRAERGTGANP